MVILKKCWFLLTLKVIKCVIFSWGHQFRKRQCNNPEPQYGGSYCEGFSDQSQICNSFPCELENHFKPAIITNSMVSSKEVTKPNFIEKTSSHSYINNICDKYCSIWSTWSSCGINCGDSFRKQSRERKCLATSNSFHIDFVKDNFFKVERFYYCLNNKTLKEAYSN